VQYSLRQHFALLADVTATHRGDITTNRYDLTQVTYAGGLRYFPLTSSRQLHPFGDLLLGGANAFSFQTGGGLTLPAGQRWTLVPVRAEYLLTTFSNGSDNHQNDLRLSAGVLFRLGRH
jgi:hypothetical protein